MTRREAEVVFSSSSSSDQTFFKISAQFAITLKDTSDKSPHKDWSVQSIKYCGTECRLLRFQAIQIKLKNGLTKVKISDTKPNWGTKTSYLVYHSFLYSLV